MRKSLSVPKTIWPILRHAHDGKGGGAKIKWWRSRTNPNYNKETSSCDLKDFLTPRTRIVALSNSSNILGQLRNLAHVYQLAKEMTRGYAHVVAEGVSAWPHVFPSVSELGVDWYGVYCHKIFGGSRMGGLCGRKSTTRELFFGASDNMDGGRYKLLEIGTVSYETCAGVLGIAEYFRDLASFELRTQHEGLLSVGTNNLQQDRQRRNQCTESLLDKYERYG